MPGRSSTSRWTVILGLLLSIGACRSGEAEVGPTREPVVLERPGSGGEASPVEPEVEATLARVRAALQSQDFSAAHALLLPIVQGELNPAYEGRVRALLLSVRTQLLRTLYSDTALFFDRPRLALGEAMTGELSLTNLSPEVMVVRAEAPTPGSRGNSKTTVRVTVDYEEFGLDGSLVRDRWSWNETLGEDLSIAPGQRHVYSIELDSLARNPGTINYRRYQVSATLYPAELLIGGQNFTGTLEFPAKTCEVFPRRYEHLAKEPLDRLEESLRKRSAQHVPLATALVPKEQHAKARALLAEVIRPGSAIEDGGVRTAALVGLRILLGWDLPPRCDVWWNELIKQGLETPR